MDKVFLKIEGPILDEGIPLHVALDVLGNFQSIVDKTYLGASGKKRVSQKDREIFHLKTTEFRHGSLEAYFDIFLGGVDLVLPFISGVSPYELWQCAKQVFSFLKLVFTFTRNGNKPTYVFNNRGDVTVHIGDNHYHYSSPVFKVAGKALPHYQNLAHLLEPGDLEKITAGEGENEDILLTERLHDLFDVPKEIQETLYELKCDIFKFNKHTNTGNISVPINQAIPPGAYGFIIAGPQERAEYIKSMLKPSVNLQCKIEWSRNPLGEDKVERFHVFEVIP